MYSPPIIPAFPLQKGRKEERKEIDLSWIRIVVLIDKKK
jgi:hypothetical protein